MKRRVKKGICIFVMAIFLLGSLSSVGFAQNPIRKLGRGVANTATGFIELPSCVANVLEEEGIVAAITYGVFKGAAAAFWRTTVGVYETVTFLLPLPWRYEPILEPEFMLSEEHF